MADLYEGARDDAAHCSYRCRRRESPRPQRDMIPRSTANKASCGDRDSGAEAE